MAIFNINSALLRRKVHLQSLFWKRQMKFTTNFQSRDRDFFFHNCMWKKRKGCIDKEHFELNGQKQSILNNSNGWS